MYILFMCAEIVMSFAFFLHLVLLVCVTYASLRVNNDLTYSLELETSLMDTWATKKEL